MRKVKSNRLPGVARSNHTIAAKMAETTVIAISAQMRSFRRSMMSASAPAGSANRNIGSVVATWTIDTMNASGLRLVISQPDAALNIHPPMFATTVAVHSSANVGWRNGLHDEVAAFTEAAGRCLSAFIPQSDV